MSEITLQSLRDEVSESRQKVAALVTKFDSLLADKNVMMQIAERRGVNKGDEFTDLYHLMKSLESFRNYVAEAERTLQSVVTGVGASLEKWNVIEEHIKTKLE